MKFTGKWFKAALIRAIRTAAQVAAGMFTVGMAVHEVDWVNVASVTVVAAIYSLITSIATELPELKVGELTPDGSLMIDESDPDCYGVFLNFGSKTVEDISGKTQVVLDVNKKTEKSNAVEEEPNKQEALQ